MRIAIVASLFLVLPILAADDKPAVKVIPTKDLKLKFDEKGKVTQPTEIKSADELAKAKVFTDDASRGAVKKQVNFEKEKLVVFVWGGSGGDKLAGELKTEAKKSTATFKFTGGLTLDYRQHFHLYAVPKDAEVKVITGK